MDSLPNKILSQISTLVIDTHEVSGAALAQASKRLHAVVDPLLLHCLDIILVSRQSIERSIPRIRARLQNGFGKYVRQLRIAGFAICDETLASPNPQRTDVEPCFSFRPHRDLIAENQKSTNISSHNQPKLDGEDASWTLVAEALARLLHDLPCLDELHFDYRERFPACLLQALHTCQPHCRLYIINFPIIDVLALDPDVELLQLVTSPNLYRIRCNANTLNGNGYALTGRVLWHMVQFASPRVKDVQLVRYHFPQDEQLGYGTHLLSVAADSIAWRELLLSDDTSPVTKPVLRRIETAMGPVGTLLSISNMTDPSCLRSLSLTQLYQEELRDLDFFIRAGASLRYLSELTLSFMWGNPGFGEILRKFVPLRKIAIESPTGLDPLDCVTSHHGAALQELRLPTLHPMIEVNQIRRLAEYCPNISILQVDVRRNQGIRQEKEMYQAIGSMPRLQTLNLRLASNIDVLQVPHCHSLSENDGGARWDDFDRERYPADRHGKALNGHVAMSLLNMALDFNLANTIFWCIAAGCSSAQSSTFPLQKLCLSTLREQILGFEAQEELEYVCTHISRPMTITRCAKDTEQDLCRIERALPPSPHMRGHRYRAKETRPLMSQIEAVFRRLWPVPSGAKKHPERWPNDWSSLPLEGVGSGKMVREVNEYTKVYQGPT